MNVFFTIKFNNKSFVELTNEIKSNVKKNTTSKIKTNRNGDCNYLI